MTLSFTKTLLAMALGSFLISPLQAKNTKTDLKEVRNEASIMLDILQATLKQESNERNIRFRADSVFYLAEQGLVFEIDGGRRGDFVFGFDFKGLLNSLPTAPHAPSADLEFNIDEGEIEDIVRSVIEHGEEFEDELKDKMHDLRDESRQLSWERRDYDRSLRDLAFEKRNADKQRRKEIEKRMAELEKQKVKLEAKSQELEKYRTELEKQRQQEMAKRKAAKEQFYKASLALFEDTIGDMLCRYGAGLRALADNEKVTFLLSDFVKADDNSEWDTQDKVYVFKHQDIQACVSGKVNKDKLLSSATTYLF